MRSKISVLLFSTLLTIAGSIAMADTTITVKTEVVRYDDLRLISAVGAAVLYGRLRGAAERACGPLDGRSAAPAARYRACVDEAIAKAVAEVNEPVLSRYVESKRGVQAPSVVASPSPTAVANAR
jgi:UrcA family protein